MREVIQSALGAPKGYTRVRATSNSHRMPSAFTFISTRAASERRHRCRRGREGVYLAKSARGTLNTEFAMPADLVVPAVRL